MAFEKLGEKFSNFFAMDNEDDYQDQEDEQAQQPAPEQPVDNHYRSNKVVSMATPLVRQRRSWFMNRECTLMPKKSGRIY